METNTWSHEPWQALLQYTACMSKVVRAWKSFMAKDFAPGYYTSEDMLGWLARLDNTLLALRDLYVYDPLRRLHVHPLASGFPVRLHIRVLEQLAKDDTAQQELRQLWLDQLFDDERINHGLLERIAKANAHTRVGAGHLKLFSIHRMQQIATERTLPAYVCTFERYCAMHRPSLYVLVFECEQKLGPELLAELTVLLREESRAFPRLVTMARHVDQGSALLHPVWLGRISLGPVFVSHMTQDEHELQTVLNAVTPAGTYTAASRFIYEHVAADKTEPVARLYDPQGRAHLFLQRFGVRDLHEECAERGVTELEKHLFAPHSIVRALSADFRRTIGHRITLVEE